MVLGLGLGLLAVSAVLLIAGAELFAENAAAAARGLGITVFGAAFLLAGAEPEEMITAVIASGRHRPGLAAGDAIGANLTMLTLVLGLAALGGWLAVGGAGRVVAALRLADSAVGLTLLALATTAELFALAWAAMRRGVTEIAVAGVVGSVAYNATASLGAAALVRPLATGGILAPAIAAAILSAALLAVTPGGRLTRQAGALLVIGYAGWVTAVLLR